MPKYFNQFPITSYRCPCTGSQKSVRDITRRAKIVDYTNKSPYIFYPYTINNWLRSDHISENYYDDPFNDWLVYMSNDIVDPYYQWYLNNDALNKLVEYKYGSLEIAQRKVKYYENNWYDDSQQLSPSFYNNNLNNSWKKYYKPVLGINTKIISYQRKEDDTRTNTNRILEYTISSDNANVSFIHDEVVNIRAAGSDATIGKGQIDFANSSILRVKSVSGNTSANSSVPKNMIGDESSANVTANGVSIYFENFSNSEAVFWKEVTYYDYEVLQNEQKRDIQLIGDDIAPGLIEEFRKKIIEDIEET